MIHSIRAQTDQGREKPRGGAGVADEKFCRLRRYFRAAACDAHGSGLGVDLDLNAELVEGRGHDFRVPAEKGVGQGDRAVGQSGEEQGAVRDALRAGQGDLAAHGARERVDRQRIGQGHGSSSVNEPGRSAKVFFRAAARHVAPSPSWPV